MDDYTLAGFRQKEWNSCKGFAWCFRTDKDLIMFMSTLFDDLAKRTEAQLARLRADLDSLNAVKEYRNGSLVIDSEEVVCRVAKGLEVEAKYNETSGK